MDHLSFLIPYVPQVILTLPFVGEVSMAPILISLFLYVVSRIFFWFIQTVLIIQAEKLAEQTATDIDNLFATSLRKIRPWFYSLLSLYLATLPLSFPSSIETFFTGIMLVLTAWQLIDIGSGIIEYVVRRSTKTDITDPNTATAAAMLQTAAKVALWAFGIIFVLSNLGFEVTSLIAGLGIGGIAIAFAIQGILSDLFASFSIYFDKPFRIGDTVTIGTDTGTIERIGIKSTRIRTLQGEELVIPNAEITKARVQNFRRMERRRVTAEIGITYNTPSEKVRRVPDVVAELLATVEHAELDRVHFTAFGDFALLFSIVYYIDSRDMLSYLNAQQTFNFMLLERFNQEGIEFAFPTQTIYTKQS